MKIKLLQNCVEDRHLSSIIPGFEPLDFRHNPRPEWREFQIFNELLENDVHRSADIVGAVSSRFYAKGLLDGHQVKQWILDNPGFDIYLANPWPQWSYTNFNSCQRIPVIHDDMDFISRTDRLLKIAGISLSFQGMGRQHNKNYGMSSYWFGSSHFWESFMADIVHPLIRLSARELGSELHEFLYRPVAYYGQSKHRPGALPFVLERLTSPYIEAAFPCQAAYYPRSLEQTLACCLYPFEQDFVRIFGRQVDEWDQHGEYDSRAMRYFDHAAQHAAHGWLAYLSAYPLDFDNGDPRPHMPWFPKGEVKPKLNGDGGISPSKTFSKRLHTPF